MRGYDDFVGDIFATVPPAVLLLALLVLTALIAAGWYWYPAWIPRRWPRLRLRLPRFSLPKLRRRRKPRHGTEPATRPTRRTKTDKTPTAARGSLADRLAAEGRYAEAIRERLRDTVADLTRAGLITPEPGDTANELATAAGTGRPAVSPALDGATGLFSDIWYGRRPAGPPEDERMRHLTAEIRDGLGGPR
ncbi:hypothetical protein Q0Z83_031460 [Actinoplanes sichuanensis]|uniref:DUF4129 domain-containing protein n=1 Tax=Actinoplanes sichuanensis TaxID=512349 RepID=A0ABW4ASH4_9ACTN|nr:DUF4129 domain-containing protein [Actinoplanes sichuanensis]BEL04955.1 hypothetical protein Q0Z83_031460 [Actinoplanes sichuanensis]